VITGLIREELLSSGASVVGVASLRGVLHDDIAHLDTAISIGVDKNLNEDTISLLVSLQKKAVRTLRREGYRYFSIPPDSDRIKNKFVSSLFSFFPHKMAATSAGIGWIGKNGLLINAEYGPRLSLATVITDAPLQVSSPIEFSHCGECSLCVEFCPSGSLTGNHWSRIEPFTELIKLDRCNTHKSKSRTLNGKPNCGLCINICPYGRKEVREKARKREVNQGFEVVRV